MGMDTPPPTRAILRGATVVRVVRTCVVEVLEGPEQGARVLLERPIFRIGAHTTNDLSLSDPTVSKHHLEVAVVPEGYRITDLGSSNGTLMGGARLGAITVVEPVTLQLGQSVVRIDLLDGETGVGKEQIAEAVHQQSARAQGPFVVVDCGALVGDLMEAELFGHAKGAFSGADRARQGLFEAASGGTLFLDEVGELPAPLQSKLLGVLERRRVVPLGTNTPRDVDVRIIAATHRNLAREVNEGRWRGCACRRCASARTTSPSWCRRSSINCARATARRCRRRCRRSWSASWRRATGRATCASCATRS